KASNFIKFKKINEAYSLTVKDGKPNHGLSIDCVACISGSMKALVVSHAVAGHSILFYFYKV
ncbi:hypothetical protein, partial [Klebsiella variicola]|uniref:hypothetical protein n=1 Tax=Klebsiella variicola TaxID=244366 RepID=UPI0039C313E5